MAECKIIVCFPVLTIKDNIENKMDGACARYIKAKRKRKKYV